MKMYNSDLSCCCEVVCWGRALDAVKSPSSDEERKAGTILAAAALATHLQPG